MYSVSSGDIVKVKSLVGLQKQAQQPKKKTTL